MPRYEKLLYLVCVVFAFAYGCISPIMLPLESSQLLADLLSNIPSEAILAVIILVNVFVGLFVVLFSYMGRTRSSAIKLLVKLVVFAIFSATLGTLTIVVLRNLGLITSSSGPLLFYLDLLWVGNFVASVIGLVVLSRFPEYRNIFHQPESQA